MPCQLPKVMGTGRHTYVVSFQGPGSQPLPSAASWSILRTLRVATLGSFKGSGGCELGFESGEELGGVDRRKDWSKGVGIVRSMGRGEIRFNHLGREG